MNEGIETFFSDSEFQRKLRRIVPLVEELGTSGPVGSDMKKCFLMMNSFIIANSKQFDECAPMNIKWIGGLYKSDIEIFLNTQQEDRSALFEKIFGSTFRFLCEFNLNVPGEIYETRSAFKFVGNNLDKFENTLRQELTFAMFAMPVSIIREILNQPEVKDLRDLASTVARSEKLKKEWDDSLDQRTRRLEGLADNIKKITSQYNFVGLVDGFKTLRTQKRSEGKFSFWTLVAIALLMVAIPVTHYSFLLLHLDQISSNPKIIIYSMPAVLVLELLFVYFFRVVLINHRSIKAQLLQLDLRISICQFVESYAEYVVKLRKEDSTILGKFEALVFSGLVVDEGKIPSTFDGVENLAAFLKTLRAAN